MKKTTYTIQTRNGPQPVSGLVAGHFGIHKLGRKWSITHLPTGLNLDYRRVLRNAREVVGWLNRYPDVDWTQTDPAAYEAASATGRIAPVRSYCLSHWMQGESRSYLAG